MKSKKLEKYSWTRIVGRDLENGIVQFECYIKGDPAPAGLVWGIACGLGKSKKPVFMVFHSFVHPWARRKGVRTAIQAELKKRFYAIFTWTGTKDGDAWMKASGFKKLRPWGLWIQDVAKAKPKKKKRRKKK